MIKQNQSGVGVIEILLIIAVLGILGFTGFFVYHSKQSADNNLPASSFNNQKNGLDDSSTNQNEAVQQLKFSTVPDGLRTAIINRFKDKVPACVSGNALVNADGQPYDPSVTYLASGFAKTGLGCNGGGTDIYYQADGAWQVLGLGQTGALCADLRSHTIPDSLVSECLPSSTTEPVAYKNS